MPQLDSITFSLQVGLFFWLFWSLYIIVVVLKLPQNLLVYYTKILTGRKFTFGLGFLLGFIFYFYDYTSIYAMEIDLALVEVPPVELPPVPLPPVPLPEVEVALPPLEVPPVEVAPNTNFFSNLFSTIFNGVQFFANKCFSIFGLELRKSSDLIDLEVLNQSHLLEKTDLLEKINSLKNQNKSIVDLESSLKNQNKSIVDLENEKKELSKSIVDLENEKKELSKSIVDLENEKKELSKSFEIFDLLFNSIKARSKEIDSLSQPEYTSFFISDFYEKILRTNPDFDKTLEKIRTLGPVLGPEFIDRFISCLTEKDMAPLLTKEDIGRVAGALYEKQIEDIEKNYEEIFITHIDAIEEQYFS